MGIYLNLGNEEFYNAVRNSKIYVDKTELIKLTNSVLCSEQRNVCVSRPRRFGKSMAAIQQNFLTNLLLQARKGMRVILISIRKWKRKVCVYRVT